MIEKYTEMYICSYDIRYLLYSIELMVLKQQYGIMDEFWLPCYTLKRAFKTN